MGPCHLGQLVDVEGPQTQPRVAWYRWSTPRDLVHHLEVSRQGQLIDTAAHRTRDRVALDSWSTPWALGPRPDSPGIYC